MHRPPPRSVLAVLCGALLLSACTTDIDTPPPDAASDAAQVQAAWVEIGDGNQALARVITTYRPGDASAPVCPQLTRDGQVSRMSLRVSAGTVPLRTTASDPADSKPSAFPVAVCEAVLPAGAQQVSVAGRTLPLPKAQPQRIAIIADTGCRMKKADNAFQACNDSGVWPFATIAASVANLAPDLVMHIGDYHYRENACPSDIAGCKDSPWGYGWDTWQADLFKPAAPLLAKAPWVVVRGNHEECARAGQGWFRFLDPRPYSTARSCDDPANDAGANYSEPYAVQLGGGSQVIVFDTAKVGRAALKTTDAQFQIYQKQFQTVAKLAGQAGMSTTIFTNHHPILAFAPIAGSTPAPGNLALQSVMSSLNAQAYYPPGVQVALHGHVHDFQAINFSSGHPATIVSGNGGDNLDVALPDPFPANLTPAPGAVIERLSHNNSFGFLMMERRAAPASGWTFKAYTAAGKLLATCNQSGTTLACDKTGFVAP
jgi:hypothetical protein